MEGLKRSRVLEPQGNESRQQAIGLVDGIRTKHADSDLRIGDLNEPVVDLRRSVLGRLQVAPPLAITIGMPGCSRLSSTSLVQRSLTLSGPALYCRTRSSPP